MNAQEGTSAIPRHIDVTHESCQAPKEIMALVGDKWSVLVVVTLGSGPKRFNELKRIVGGITQRMLTVTLRGLERDGLVSRTVYPTVPPSVEYALTDLGKTLIEPVTALATWAIWSKGAIDQARKKFDERKAASL